VGERRKILAIRADPHEVTALLLAWRKGDEGALEQIVPRVHDELQKIARRCMRGAGAARVPLEEALVITNGSDPDVIALSETVARDWRLARAWLRRELGGQ
jgi:hypothetical protein